MSADKRKTILIAFAGLAVVLVAVIFVVSPSFKSEDASGAIGAVQKHRQPQITKADVILGSEKQRNEQRVRYADYLKDAAALHSLSRNFANAKSPDALGVSIDARKSDVQARFVEDIEEAALGLRKVAEADDAALGAKKAAMIAEIDSIGAKAKARPLESQDMGDLAAQIRSISDALGLKKTEVRRLEDFDSNSAAAMIRAQVDYADALASEEALLYQVRDNLGMIAENRKRLDSAADTLEARAVDGMKATLQGDQEAIEALGHMAESQASMQSQVADARTRAKADMSFALDAMRSYVNDAESLNMRLSDAFAAELGALAESRASVIGESDTFAMQAHQLLQKVNQQKVNTADARTR